MADWYFRNQQKQSLQTCPGCRNLVKKGEEFCPFCAKRLGPESGVRALFRRVLARPDAVTRIILGMMVAMFLVQLVVEMMLPAGFRELGRGGLFSFLTVSGNTYIILGANYTPLILAGQAWRFVTYCFLHIGLLHILFNSWAMWDLGRLVERMWGGMQLFATFILTGVAGGFASFAWANYALGAPRLSAGASGAICGVLGLLLGAYYRNRYHVGEYLGSQLLRWAIYILVFGLVAGADNSAHIGGMVAGGLLGYFMPPTRTTNTGARDAKIWRILAVISVVLLVAAYAFDIVFAAQGLAFARSY